MRITPKLAAFAVAGLALAAPATAMAASHGAAHHAGASHSVVASSEPTGPDHDSLQQGDQTSPDTASGTAKAATVKATSPTPEPSSPEGESAAESEFDRLGRPGRPRRRVGERAVRVQRGPVTQRWTAVQRTATGLPRGAGCEPQARSPHVRDQRSRMMSAAGRRIERMTLTPVAAMAPQVTPPRAAR